MNAELYIENLKMVDMLFKSNGDVTLPEFRLMHELSKIEEGVKITEISNNREITNQSIGRMCSSLEKRGLIEIVPHKRDKRVKIVALTRKGSTLEKKFKRNIEKVLINESEQE